MHPALRPLYWAVVRQTDRVLLELYRRRQIGLMMPAAALARRTLVKDFPRPKPAYRTADELAALVEAAVARAGRSAEPRSEAGPPPSGRVLFVYPKYMSQGYTNSSGAGIRTVTEDVWVDTARTLGLTVAEFGADRIAYLPESARNTAVLREETDRLVAQVRAFQPDLVFMDINFLGNANTLNQDVVRAIRRVHDCGILGHVGDYYADAQIPIVQYWSEVLDLVLHSSPGMSDLGLPNLRYIHYFANERSFHPAPTKAFDITFAGSGNIARYEYVGFVLEEAKRRGYRAAVTLHNCDAETALTPDEYARQVRESRAVMNLSARASGVRPVTGRVQQTIASKSLLLEESNEAIGRIFEPFAHFIPFDSTRQLGIAMEFATAREDLARRVSELAYDKYRREHASACAWTAIFGLCKHARASFPAAL